MNQTPDNITLLTKISGDVGGIKADIRTMKDTQAHQQNQLDHQNNLLGEHILGVQTNTERINIERDLRRKFKESTDLRLEKLEELPKFKKQALKYIGHLAGVLGATMAGIVSALKFKNEILAFLK